MELHTMTTKTIKTQKWYNQMYIYCVDQTHSFLQVKQQHQPSQLYLVGSNQCHVLYQVQHSVTARKAKRIFSKKINLTALGVCLGFRACTCNPTHCHTTKQAWWKRHSDPSRPSHQIYLTWEEKGQENVSWMDKRKSRREGRSTQNKELCHWHVKNLNEIDKMKLIFIIKQYN